MGYRVKEIFYTLQGEGANTGRPAVFCRFSGCNLWSGHEENRASAICQFCDTDFAGVDGTGGGEFRDEEDLADAVSSYWPQALANRSGAFVVCTGGEPLLQMDAPLVRAFHERQMTVAIETNGTRIPPEGIDWICVSPKAGSELVLQKGDELKLVYPQVGANPEQFEHLRFRHFFLQPLDGPDREHNSQLAIRYCLEHPRWRLSLQTHKFLGIR